jgi:D-methionine transport system substrate-binding protein
LLLQREGIIGLKENVGIQPKVTDIVSNPKQVKIIEMEAPQLPRVLDDPQVTIAIINNSFASQAGLDPGKQGLFTEDKESPYVNLIVARSDNKNDEKVQQFIQAYQSPEVEATAKKSSKMAPLKAGKILTYK